MNPEKVTEVMNWYRYRVYKGGLTCLVILGLFAPQRSKAQATNCPTITNTSQTSVTVCSGYIVDSLQVKTTAFWPDKIELVRFDTPQTNPYTNSDGVSLGELISSNSIATMRTIAFPANTGLIDKTYYIYGRLKPASTDPTCAPFALLTVTVKPAATAIITAQEATCKDSVSAADGWVRISNFTPTDTYEISTNGLFSGASQPIPADGIVARNSRRTGKPETYKVRIYSAFGCYVERSVTLANTFCYCPSGLCVPIMITRLQRSRIR